MSLNSETRQSSIKDADLIGLGNKIIAFLTRDLETLSVYGITGGKIAEIEELINSFVHFPSDIELLSDVINSTQTKNRLKEDIKEAVRKMVLRCRMKWGANSSQEKSLETTGMANFTDENLLFMSRRVHSQMTIFLPELVETGLTQELLDNLESLNVFFETEINNKKDKIYLRETQTKLRISMANELFRLISKYSQIGKQVFFMTNEALYNDYLIHKKRRKKAKKQAPTSGEILAIP